MEVNGFENSKNLVLSVHLIGDTAQQQTRLFEKNILSEGDYPLDIKVTLKVNSFDIYDGRHMMLVTEFKNSRSTDTAIATTTFTDAITVIPTIITTSQTIVMTMVSVTNSFTIMINDDVNPDKIILMTMFFLPYYLIFQIML